MPLTFLAKALREIRFYQGEAMADKLLIPQASFHRVVKEVCLHYHQGLRWERDALVALQMFTEHILTMFFEMT